MAGDKRAKKQKRDQFRIQRMQSEIWQLREAARWPVTDCFTTGDWHAPHALIQIILVRTHRPADPASRLAVGVYLVDLGCLGLKNTFGRIMTPPERDRMLESLAEQAPMTKSDPAVAMMILQAGIDYARSLGFEPHADFRKSAALWAEITPATRDEKLCLGGDDGKPFFMAGPDDDGPAITRQLATRLGEDGFNYVIAG